MSVICFASLKGGVGKTSLSINVAHAFAQKGHRVLLIDLDPCAHASNFFRTHSRTTDYCDTYGQITSEAPLARLILQNDCALSTHSTIQLPGLIIPARSQFDVIPSGGELRHFHWGQGAKLFRNLFPQTIKQLLCEYDKIVIDTSPDWNVITRNAIAVSDVVAVPVDSSIMSIHCLEEITSNSSHIMGPQWVIVRSMVHRAATRVQKLSEERLSRSSCLPSYSSESEDIEECFRDSNAFISLLRKQGEQRIDTSLKTQHNPIYLLASVIYRTEQLNRLSFLRKTAFDSRETENIAEQYLSVSRELESTLALPKPQLAESPAVCGSAWGLSEELASAKSTGISPSAR